MKKLYIILFIALPLLMAGSCSKQLNVYPTTSEVDGTVIKDLQSAKTALNGIYYRFANAGVDNNQNPSVLWVMVNENIPSQLSGMCTYPYGGSELTDHRYQSTSSYALSMWKYGMNVVNAANGFLKNLELAPSIMSSAKKELEAEVKFLRAYANATLLAYFGQYEDPSSDFGIVLRTEFVTSKNVPQPRSSVEEAYDLIFADLEVAIAGLPKVNSANYYANVWAAKLLKARVLMIRNQAQDKAAVITLCQHIIDSSQYALESSTRELFLNKGLQSSEVMLGIKPYPQDIYKYNNYIYYNTVVGTRLMQDLFKDDPRAGWMMSAKYNSYESDSMQVVTKYFSGEIKTPAATATSSVSYAMRLTEAYLLEAEAIAQSGGDLSTAKTLLKTVMGKAGITNFFDVDNASTPEALQLLVVQEEMRNFVGEAGQAWFALRRLPFATVKKMVPTLGSKDLFILPIPQDEMNRNSGIKGMQNPGYGGS